MPSLETVESQEPSSRYVRPPVRVKSCFPEEEMHEDTPPDEEHVSPSSISIKPPVAVFVVHGMGQQIRFETLDRTVKCLLKAAGAHPETPINVRTVQVRDHLMRRAEFQLEDKSNGADPQDVHVYEGYWAPITEGRIVLTDVLWFLFYAGIRTFGGQGRRMQRWMFGRSVTFSIPVETRNAFSVTFFVFLSLVVIGALVSVVAGSYLLLPGAMSQWPGTALLNWLTAIAGIYAAFCILFGGALYLVSYGAEWLKKSQAVWAWLNRLLWWLFFFLVAATILTALWLCWLVGRDLLGGSPAQVERTGALPEALVWSVWLVLFVIFRVIRDFLIRYLGDVVAYVSSHRLDRFFDIRARIKQRIHDDLCAVYSQCHADGSPIYARVGLIAHSLGSVVLYDALNSLLNEDEILGSPLNVAERTKAFVTFGSPLDKIAYVFRLQGTGTATTEIREALAASVQPLIVDYATYRTMKWINVYADRDIIGGSLDLFDLNFGKETNAPTRPDLVSLQKRRIVNRRDKEAIIPLYAHQELWDTGLVFKEFYQAFLA